jgi:hypothetical protein
VTLVGSLRTTFLELLGEVWELLKRAQSKTGTPSASASFPPQRAKAASYAPGPPLEEEKEEATQGQDHRPAHQAPGAQEGVGGLLAEEGLHLAPSPFLHQAHPQVQAAQEAEPEG